MFGREKTYRDKDGCKNYQKFMCDWPFSSELLHYVEQVYGENRWFIDHCAQIGPGTYSARFLPIWGKTGVLYVKIVHNEGSEIGWDFLPG